MGILVDVSKDADHADEAKWATHIVQECAGLKGFQRLVSFNVEADFFHNFSEAITFHDSDKNDVSVSQLKLEQCLDRGRAMFDLGYIFDSEPNASYTWRFLNGAQCDLPLYVGSFESGSSQAGVFGWESINSSQLEQSMKFAKSLYQMMEDK